MQNFDLLSKAEILEKLNKSLSFPASEKRFIVHVLDFKDNGFSPERYAYKIAYTCSVLGERHNVTFYPYTVGIQGKTSLKGKLLKD